MDKAQQIPEPTPQAEAADSPVDFQEALGWVDGDKDLLVELVGIFLQDYPPRIEELRAAVSNGDADRIHLLAHGLKGSLTPFGTRLARNLAQRLELIGKERNLTEAPAVFRALEEEVSLVAKGLTAPEWRAP